MDALSLGNCGSRSGGGGSGRQVWTPGYSVPERANDSARARPCWLWCRPAVSAARSWRVMRCPGSRSCCRFERRPSSRRCASAVPLGSPVGVDSIGTQALFSGARAPVFGSGTGLLRAPPQAGVIRDACGEVPRRGGIRRETANYIAPAGEFRQGQRLGIYN